ncbi:hypothetical protein LIER_15958 [Lithospermum erythrorhizon]|uniref:Reverse transcriptase zinc-binding domain-containing protein n=1 Tax=Lithospermum erythrorhizon TaxID=34254 RepID=A0AAV3Q7C0_LITER
MDFFSELLKSKIRSDNFEYHRGCKKINLVNMSFADDLFIMCGAKGKSMQLVKSVLEEFGEYSGFKHNLAKSSCYFAGTRKEVLWVRWINTVRLKGQSFLGIKVRGVDSWVWKKILTLREDLKENVMYMVENRKTVNCLYHIWSSVGVMAEVLSDKDISNLNLRPTDTIVEFMSKLRWPCGRRVTAGVQIYRDSMPIAFTDCADEVEWFVHGKHHTAFVWNQLRSKPSDVWWWKVVWFSDNVPKFSFITWVLFLERLHTKDQLHRWGVIESSTCYFC